jgi:hypothetical protein
MFIAREKSKENIVEYLLYMFHIEDIIRANHGRMEELEKNVISKYNLPDNQNDEILEWYQNLIDRMDKEDTRQAGHLSSLKELMFQLNDLHLVLLNSLQEERYIENYHWAANYIKELKNKMNNPGLTEIEVCLDGLYGYMLLKMKGVTINEETLQAMSVFSQMLRYLSLKYHSQINS